MDDAGLKDYLAARDWLFALKNRGVTYGIDRMAVFIEELGRPDRSYPIIHVAGTNGKGSTCAMLEAMFRKNGYRTGLSTSPHFVRQGERFQVNRKIMSEDEILERVRHLKRVGERIAARDPDLHPSFFEFMTGLALTHFERSKVDVAMVEVGLGGRLDATNVVRPEVSVITSIGLDHCEMLGHTYREVAREKGGIIKLGVPVVIGWLPDEAEEEITRICEERGCKLHRVRDLFGEDLSTYPETNLPGDFQRINAGVAELAISVYGERMSTPLDALASREALKSVHWPGRWDVQQMKHRKVVFDVSHNSEGAVWLDRQLRKLVEEDGMKPDVVMGVLGAYRARALVSVVSKYAHSIRLVKPQQSRSCSFEELEGLLAERFDGEVSRCTVEELFPGVGECALDEEVGRSLVVTGSIYLIGEIWERFREEEPVGQGILQDF